MQVISELTEDFQTTVPRAVCEALKLEAYDKLHYAIHSSGEVVLTRAQDSKEGDPALGRFLSILATDIVRHPERLRLIDSALPERLRTLLGNVDIDLHAKLPPDDPSDDGQI